MEWRRGSQERPIVDTGKPRAYVRKARRAKGCDVSHIGSFWLYLARRRGRIHSSELDMRNGVDVPTTPGAGVAVEHQSNVARNAVELRRITARYKTLTALNGIDLTIREGEFFSLLGPSGCGKSTTLNIIGGFIEPDEGEVLIAGRPVNRIPPYRRPVNTVFQ